MKPSQLCLLLLCLFVSPVAAQQKQKRKLRPGRLPRELRKALIPGLAVAYRSGKDPHRRATRVSRLAALLVRHNQPPTALVPAGPFTATFRGYIKLKLKGKYRFHFVGRGKVDLSINAKEVVKGDLARLGRSNKHEASLIRGYNRITIRYQSPSEGDSQLRLYWTGPEFPREPIPPSQLFTDGRYADLVKSSAIYEGRSLFANRQCGECHTTPRESAKGMPELQRDAPNLTGIGTRLRPAWVANWISDPAKLRSRATMPHVLHGLSKTQNRQMAADISAYLSGLKSKLSVQQRTRELPAGDARKGEILFEDFGCITCHRFTSPTEADEEEMMRLSLHFTRVKFRTGGLQSFLRDPRAHYKFSRMPRFKLSDQEVADLAAHISKHSKGKLATLASGNAVRGKQAMEKMNCLQCHQNQKKIVAKNFSLFSKERNLDRGCLAKKPPPQCPDYRFDELSRQKVVAFLRTGYASLLRRVAGEFATRNMKQIRCTSCHNRDGQNALFPYVLSEEGSQGHPPEAIPALTWTGEKLHYDWMVKLFSGKLKSRTRQHLRARMPEFPARAKSLAYGLAQQHGFFPNEDKRPKFNKRLAGIGKALAAMNSGMSCNRCHPVGGVQPLAPFDARSTNFNQVSRRLRYEYYQRWMLHPQRVDPTTKMLKFAPDGKRTSLTKILQGNADRQFEALWHYLLDVGRSK